MVSARAVRNRSSAAALVGPCAMTLASSGFVSVRHQVARLNAGIHPDAGATRQAEVHDPSGRGQEPVLRVLGVDPDLDGVAVEADAALLDAERLPGRDPQLIGDEVSARHRLGDRVVLDLEPGVHLEEKEFVVIGHQEFDRASPDVTRSTGHWSAASPSAARRGALTAGAGDSSRIFCWRR